ncbi:MAG: bifunctional acetate--CoA ligase family protein/GNAT family N-acetyltransferase [Proteobacteria bacterium]|nr:bifunctional acetate--CoA ligase family protein/GNAT family N-acetyltransferase [Pseudomonadota bacterium]
MDRHYLTSLLSPQAIVVFADESGSELARTLLAAFKAQQFRGRVQFLAINTSGTLGDLSQAQADLAIIALPPKDASTALGIAARIGCRAAVMLGNGVSAHDAALMQAIAQREGLHMLGPNSLGLQRPHLLLNASAAGPLAAPGPLALVSQSGSLTASMLDWARENAVGFSCVVAMGPHAGVDVPEVLDFLASDAHTHSIVVHLEGIGNARRFMSALRSAASAKPVIILKAGRTSAGNEAARTHSAALVGADAVFDAALRRAGAVRVRSFVELFSAAKCLASRYRPVGPRLAVVTNGGGPGVLAADWIGEIGLTLGKLSPAAAEALQPQLPAHAALSDLIDLSEDALAPHFKAAIDAANRDPAVDGVLVIYSPKPDSDGQATAKVLAEMRPSISKPLLACWLGETTVLSSRAILKSADIPTFRTPEPAVSAFGNIAAFYQNQQLLQQTPPPLTGLAPPDVECARLVIESALAERRTVLTEMESKAVLAAFHIPVTPTAQARNANEAMQLASQMGFPVAMKIDSPDVSHKSDVQGVVLNVTSGVAVRETFETMMDNVGHLQPKARINGVTVQKMASMQRGREVSIGVVCDAALGPVITFGAGGTAVELMNDQAMELPPLNQFLARRLIERARVAKTLGAWHGAPPVDMQALEHLLLRVSEMICELPHLQEMDINPVIVDAHGAVAVDARIVVRRAQYEPLGSGHYQHLAIMPYPAYYRQTVPLAGDLEYTLRPIRPDDAEMLQELVRSLSPESRYFRFVSARSELTPGMLARFTLIDYDREMALVAVLKPQSESQPERIIGVSRYITSPDQQSCEFALVVADAFSGQGIGSRLMQAIIDVARERGLAEIYGLVLAHNPTMLKLMQSLGFSVEPCIEEPDFRLVKREL